ncbi:type IV secretion system protein VirD4 [Desulfohalotomaculum tongense]|uniref:VirD4-like conjugal transfer protein, CD1115 family n=1 Tax=Desulforadius tongensis TaxID=1216062 RepID=UPI001956C7A5|nr:type IV secretory system conjugative DNA transfer family protein [Desulforadius tongensis]MBM7854920.1 type IV secretion system protein VirD4 [Desulforadius tongensis]
MLKTKELLDKLPKLQLPGCGWVQEHKKAALILGSVPVAVPLFYFADVWTVGSVAAAVHDLQHHLSAVSIFSTPEEKAVAAAHGKMLPYVFRHPFSVGWAWLSRPAEMLTHPDVKRLWQYLNVLLGAGTAVGYLWWRNRQRNGPDRVHGLKLADNAALGTARWAALRDVKHLCEFGPPKIRGKDKGSGGIVLGKLDGKIVRVIPGKSPKGKPGLAGHAAIFGGTGSGKSFSFVLSNIVAAVADGQSFICTDPKGELAATTARWLKKKGYEVRIFNLTNPAVSHRWNAISECGNDAEIAEMAACLIHNAGKDDSTYFLAKEVQLLEALTGLLKGDFPAEQQHLRAAMSLTAWTKEDLDVKFKAAYQAGKISATIYERWRGVASANFDHAVSGLSAKLKILTTEPLAALLSEHEIKLGAVGRRKTALFCVIPVSGEGKVLRPILSTFYMFLFKRLYRLADQHNGKLPVPVRFLLDEFANIGQIPGFSEIISTARSLGIHIQFILQGRSQLDDVYGPNEAKNILANCPTILLLGVTPSDQETASMFSRILGKAAVEGRFEKEDLTIPMVHYFKFAEKTQSAIKRSLMEPDEITRMDPLDCIALIQWCYPLYLKKLGWVKLPQAKKIKKAGKLEVSELVPPRSFEVDLPEIIDSATTLTKSRTVISYKTKKGLMELKSNEW